MRKAFPRGGHLHESAVAVLLARNGLMLVLSGLLVRQVLTSREESVEPKPAGIPAAETSSA